MLIERKWKKWVYYAPMAVFIVFTLFPFYWMAITAFRPDEELYATWRQPNAAPLWTLAPTLEHMKGLLQTTAFPTWLWNTMLIATVSTIISLICGTFAGYALARLRFQGSNSSAPRFSSPISCRRRCFSSRSPTSSATCSSATRRGR